MISHRDVLPVSEIPVMNVSFYLMGREEVDTDITLQIGENIEYLNQEFEGKIKFKLNELFMDSHHAYIPDIHQEYVRSRPSDIMEVVADIEISGSINIFLFDTYSKNDGITAMTGFTPILSRKHKTYILNSPKFDRMFIAYPGLMDKSTIVHEMGHFLGLSHPWEMHKLDQELMGFNADPLKETNHMTYHPEVDHFTDEQLERMQHFALNFRKYLLKEVEADIN